MNIYITSYQNGVVHYTYDYIPSKMVISEDMIRETFPKVEKIYPMILGLIDEQLVVIIDKFHQLSNHIERVYTQQVYLDYRVI
jgi:hypothetical protein